MAQIILMNENIEDTFEGMMGFSDEMKEYLKNVGPAELILIDFEIKGVEHLDEKKFVEMMVDRGK